MSDRRLGAAGAVLVVAGVILLGASVVLASGVALGGSGAGYGPGMMGGHGYGPGMMGGHGYGRHMMGGYDGSTAETGPEPGDAGYIPGTAASPRVIQIIAGPGYTFTPADITVQRGETVTFQVTSMGPLMHEFMVGPADAVAADEEGTPEIADLTMMETRSLTYTFDGSGPYAFACHADDHYQQGMRGTITVVG